MPTDPPQIPGSPTRRRSGTTSRRTLQRNGAAGCAALGAYCEVGFQLRGDFYDPTA